MRKLAILGLLMTLAIPTYAQNPTPAPPVAPQTAPVVDFKDLLYGKSVPLSFQLKELNAEWRCISVSDATAGNSATGLMTGIMGAMFGGGGGAGKEQTLAVYYTKGQILTIAGETFVVTYRSHLKQPDLMALIAEGEKNGGKEPDPEKFKPEKLTPESKLTVSLLNIKTIGSIHDVHTFDMKEEIENSGKSDGGLAALMAMGAAGKGAGNMPDPKLLQPTPAELTAKIKDAIAKDTQLKDTHNMITLEVKDDVVLLKGHVVSATVKKHAEEVVQKVLDDVSPLSDIDNQLTVTPPKK